MRLYNITPQESKYITIMRAMALILVIYLHQYVDKIGFAGQEVSLHRSFYLEEFEYLVSRIIVYAGVPLFYLISSVLLYSKEFTWIENMKKKSKSLILPYLLWITIYMLIYYVGQSIPMTAPFFANPSRMITNFNVLDFIGAYTGYVGNGLFVNALWFVRDLIIFNIFAVVIKKAIDRFPVIIFLLNLLHWILGVKLFFSTVSICFFIFGYYIVKWNIHMDEIKRFSKIELIVSYIVLIGLQFYTHYIGSDFEIGVGSISVLIGIGMLIIISKAMIDRDLRVQKLFILISQYSFFIYASHDMIQTIYKKLFAKMLLQSELVQFIEYLLIPIMTIATCILIGMAMKRMFNKGYQALSGGRA